MEIFEMIIGPHYREQLSREIAMEIHGDILINLIWEDQVIRHKETDLVNNAKWLG